MTIKATWIVCSMDGTVLCDDRGNPFQEYKTEKDALQRAKWWVNEGSDKEAWVYKLSHVVSRVDGCDIDKVS